MPRTIIRLALGLALIMALPACGVLDYFFLPPPQDTAEELYEAGLDAMQAKEYGDAAEYFTQLKDRYPFSPYTQQAELSLGDAYFLDGEYAAAADAYKEYESLHPRNEQIPYVLYQLGVASYNQFSSIDRPQPTVSEALEYFNRLRELYPGTRYAEEAGRYLRLCRRYLADHELYVADFYWDTERYGPAWHRYEFVAATFSDLPEVVEYANRMAELSYYEYQQQVAEEARVREHGSWKEYFDWL